MKQGGGWGSSRTTPISWAALSIRIGANNAKVGKETPICRRVVVASRCVPLSDRAVVGLY